MKTIVGKLERFVARNGMATRRAMWRAVNDYSPNATAVFVLGAQRSGTTMLLHCFQQSMRFEVLGEASRAMVNYRIRSDDFILDTVRGSRHRFVVLKPLTDSHRGRQFLDLIPGSYAIWAFRRVEDRVNSSVAKFGPHNLEVLRDLSQGKGLERWQAAGLTDDDFEFIRRFDYEAMSPYAASAIFWYLRNSLFFHQGLEAETRVLPLAYESLASEPERMMRGVCRFIGAEFEPAMIRNVHARSIGRSESRLPEDVQALCQPMYERLFELQQARWRQLDLDGE